LRAISQEISTIYDREFCSRSYIGPVLVLHPHPTSDVRELRKAESRDRESTPRPRPNRESRTSLQGRSNCIIVKLFIYIFFNNNILTILKH